MLEHILRFGGHTLAIESGWSETLRELEYSIMILLYYRLETTTPSVVFSRPIDWTRMVCQSKASDLNTHSIVQILDVLLAADEYSFDYTELGAWFILWFKVMERIPSDLMSFTRTATCRLARVASILLTDMCACSQISAALNFSCVTVPLLPLPQVKCNTMISKADDFKDERPPSACAYG